MTSASTSPTSIGSLRPVAHDRTPEPSPHRPPRGRDSPAVHYTSGNDQTPRVGGSMRGIPRNSEALGSPHRYPDSGGSSVARPGYGRTQTSTAYPVTYPVNPSHSGHGYQSSTMGTVSRSASRARMPLKDVVAPPKKGDNEDDEEEVVDRGADLIKRRQRERKQARKKKEQERRKAEGGVTPAITPGITPNPSAPTSGVAGESFGGQQDRIAIARSASRSRVGSSANQDGSESYFSSSWSSSVTPHAPPSPRDELHPPSIYSSAADDDDDEEEDDARASMVNEVIHDVVEEAEDDEEDEDEGDNGEDGEGVTLKDRQDVSLIL
jgi:Ca2+:H+ antiporter